MDKFLILGSYLKERASVIVLYLVQAAVFMGIAALYDYGQIFRNMCYAFWLALFIMVCFFLWDYLRYRKKYIALQQIKEMEERARFLPQTSSGTEVLYQDVIALQESEKQELVTALDKEQQDMADYYTMWTHQIKTPLAAMRLLLQSEEASSLDTVVRKQIMAELFKTEQYADMALSYARLASISSDLSFRQQDVYEIIKGCVKKYSVLLIGSGLGFSLEEFEAVTVTDRKWFAFVVEQILSNALKYTDNGKIAIYGTDEEGNKTAKDCEFIVIEDTGIGIDESDLPRIFERGFTGCNGRMDKKSTGIGLYLCKQVMDRLGLGIRVESRRGAGTRVLLAIRP